MKSINPRFAISPFLIGLITIGLSLSACSKKEAPVMVEAEPQIFNTIPCEQLGAAEAASDAHVKGGLPPSLAGLYDRSCKICHENPQAGAPLKGNTEHWQPRLAKGMDVLLDHTINGFKGMPPLGLCMACSDKEFRAMITYMAENTTEVEQ